MGDIAPWERNVPSEKQEKAEQLFQEAKAYLEESRFVAAEAKYRESLGIWDHPATHYSLAQLLFRQGKLLTVHEHITKALLYGEAALGKERLKRAQSLKDSVEKQLARLEIVCDVPGATVAMGEETLCRAPARLTRWVLPADYTFTSSKEGYSSERNTRRRTFRSGENVTLHFRMYTDDELKRSQRSLPGWVPWTVMGGGAAIAASGGWLYTRAHQSHQAFDKKIAECHGCIPEPNVAALRARGDRLQLGASGAYLASGTALLAGLVLLVTNKEQTRYVTADEHERQMNITPMLGAQRGAVVTIHY